MGSIACSAANGMAQKMYNWNTLNMKVMRKLGFSVSCEEMESCAQAQPNAIERVLKKTHAHVLKTKVTPRLRRKAPL